MPKSNIYHGRGIFQISHAHFVSDRNISFCSSLWTCGYLEYAELPY